MPRPAFAHARTSALVVACAFLAGCAGPRADTVLIIDKEGASVRGKLAVEVDASGQLSPKPWVAGNVVVFRVSQELRGQQGDSGGIYRITKEDKLRRIGTADLKLSDDQLAAQFGIRAKADTSR